MKAVELRHASSTHPSWGNEPIEATLAHLIQVVDFYEGKVGRAGDIKDANDVMKIIAAEIEANGVHGAREAEEAKPM